MGKNKNSTGDADWATPTRKRSAAATECVRGKRSRLVRAGLDGIYGDDAAGTDDEGAQRGNDAQTPPSSAFETPTHAKRRPTPLEPVVEDADSDKEEDDDLQGDDAFMESVSQAGEDEPEPDEGDPLAHYRKALAPELVLEHGLDGRTRIGAQRQIDSIGGDFGEKLSAMVLEADRCAELNAAAIPDLHNTVLDQLRKSIKVLDITAPLITQKALLARDSQDIMVSPSWARLVDVLGLQGVAEKFDLTKTALRKLSCNMLGEIRIFKHVFFKVLVKDAIAKGEASAARLAHLFKAFHTYYEDIDAVEEDPILVESVQDWTQCWVGIVTLVEIDFNHENSEDDTCVYAYVFVKLS